MQHRRIIKQGPIVLATQEDGAIDPTGPSSQGMFLADTRYLNCLQVQLAGESPVLLGSSEEILFEAAYLLTNLQLDGIAARAIGILWHNKIVDGVVHIELRLANWSSSQVSFELSIRVGSDFYDSFEARGVKRLKRGEIFPPEASARGVRLTYLGLDKVKRTTSIETNRDIDRWDDQRMYFNMVIDPGAIEVVSLSVSPEEEAPSSVNLGVEPSIENTPTPAWFDDASTISTGNTLVESIIRRSIDDLEVLLTDYMGYSVPAAGLPRFAVPFGRDSIITGLETLVWNHHLSRDVLYFLAKTQGTQVNPYTYEQPGKIMHEMHTGELARLKEIPFGLFYGSVDSTPLFLVLGAEYLRWTCDTTVYRDLAPHFDAAWNWIDEYGDIDGSGYIQYKAHTPPAMSSAALTVGLYNQGWKDSANAVVYSNGEIVTCHPVALAEVQGDLYRALHLWSQVFEFMPEPCRDTARAAKLAKRAEDLKNRFNEEFWMEDKAYFAMALDGEHHQVDSITSNPAECLWSRLIAEEHAAAVAEKILSPSMFTSWGIRTMAETEKAYNPFSYHNGSVWPFENAIIASGLKKYGLLTEVGKVFDAMLQASLAFEYRRWPEVYCGVSRARAGVLAQQPDASRPQAWSSGAIFLLMQTLLGVAPAPFSRRVNITPHLPDSLQELTASNLSIVGSPLGLRLVRDGGHVLLDIRDNPDDLDIVVHPPTMGHHHSERRVAVPTAPPHS